MSSVLTAIQDIGYSVSFMRLKTIGLISILALGLLYAPLPTEAQQVGKVYRIGILRSGSPFLLFPSTRYCDRVCASLNIRKGRIF